MVAENRTVCLFFGSLAMTWNLEGTGWTLSSLTGYRRKYDLFGSDSDHSAVSLFGSATAEPLFANTNRNNCLRRTMRRGGGGAAHTPLALHTRY